MIMSRNPPIGVYTVAVDHVLCESVFDMEGDIL
jgi:hypothetical protein